jgi:hypothetical protein
MLTTQFRTKHPVPELLEELPTIPIPDLLDEVDALLVMVRLVSPTYLHLLRMKVALDEKEPLMMRDAALPAPPSKVTVLVALVPGTTGTEMGAESA